MKIARILLTVLLVLGLTACAYAAQSVKIVDEKDTNMESRRMASTSVSAGANNLVSTSTIVPGRTRILGYSIIGSESLLVALYDDSSINITRSILLNESEVLVTDQRPIWFPNAIKVTYGLIVRKDSNSTNSTIIIYYLPD